MYNYDYKPQPRYPTEIEKEMVLSKILNSLILTALISGGITFLALSGEVAIVVLLFILAIIGMIISVIGYWFARKESTISTLYNIFVPSYAVLMGLTFYMYIVVFSNALEIITTAFGVTALIVYYMYNKIVTERPDTRGMMSYLRPLSIVFIILIIFSFFISGGFFELIFSLFAAFLFSLYIYYDFGRLMNGHFTSPARIAWDIYWDILIVFKYIMRILFMIAGNRR
ncbi:MAG: Bax inhibitor-1 family protein [Candidatus Heimdallarchaeota archaeon]|nr:Bax inhibitor-1 family protein [Candidatus Heimdallarchaeota archaeon]MDH5646936.1 Bax inhibitor-1 family protein [Candidatus Heimdallarchaeota archaeon]